MSPKSLSIHIIFKLQETKDGENLEKKTGGKKKTQLCKKDENYIGLHIPC
jgi:hypothetical protein